MTTHAPSKQSTISTGGLLGYSHLKGQRATPQSDAFSGRSLLINSSQSSPERELVGLDS